jgi:lipoprotein-anchoring transpeptidase ErfK/SrfK
MQAPSVARRVLSAVLAIALFTLSGTMAWAVAEDLGNSDVVPAGARVLKLDGTSVEIGGMTRGAARAFIETNVVDPVLKPVVVRTPRGVFTLNPRAVEASGIVSVNVEQLLDQAMGEQGQTPFVTRLVQSLSGETTTVEPIKPVYSTDTTKTAAWVRTMARRIDSKPRNATRRVVGNRLVVVASRNGLTTRQPQAVAAVMAALKSAKRDVTLPVKTLAPTVTEKSFGWTIIVDKSQRRLYLYRYGKLHRNYRVAVGMPGFPTPLGQFKIVLKRYRPTWSNPGSAWAASMPAYIPPGPGNPLGTRALNLSASGIRIHGTNKISSIGTAASHGCIRMLRANVEELYDFVPVGTPVYVVP